jgi:hypothetical protein
MSDEPDSTKVVVLVAQLPCGTHVQIELTLRIQSLPPKPPTALPRVVA